MSWSSGPVAMTPLGAVACGSMLARVGSETRAVVIAKVTFALGAERAAWVIDPIPLFEIDRHREGDPKKSVVAAGDFAPYLPNAGVVVTGSARAPGGAAATTALVGVAIFRDGAALFAKSIHIYGDRRPGQPHPTPFVEMPIVYERAFGGPKTPENPIGIGDVAAPGLPNIVDPKAPRTPAGFGPIPSTWEPRRSRLWRANVGYEGLVSIYPERFPWNALHAAPDDQRLDRLRGDEWIVLQGFSTKHAQLRSQLPSARVEARFTHAESGAPLAPIALEADTLAIDADRSTATVTWRGHLTLASLREAERLRVFVGLALPSAPVAWPLPIVDPPVHQEEDTTIVAAAGPVPAVLPFEPAPNSAPRPTAPTPAANVGPIRGSLSGTGEIIWGPMRQTLPFSVPGVASASDPVARVDAVADAAADAAVEPPAIAPPEPPAAPALIVAKPVLVAPPIDESSGDVRAIAIARAKAGIALTGLDLAGADLSGVDLGGADLSAASLDHANLAGAVLTRAKLAHAKLTGADLSGARLDAADLEGADLSRARLAGASLEGARLAAARFDGARAEKANFTGAHGDGVTLRRASLDGAAFAGAKLRGVDLSGASLHAATFTNAELEDARLGDVRGDAAAFDGAALARAKLAGATLSNASFRLAVATGSTWDGANVDGAAFDAADLRDASLYRASLGGASMADADLRGANLQRISAAGASFERARLDRADLRQARLTGARFDDASLRSTLGALADFSGASFEGADLADAALRGAIFVEANFAATKLDRADLRDANLDRARVDAAALATANAAGATTSNLVAPAPRAK